jgi:hypothetical protein
MKREREKMSGRAGEREKMSGRAGERESGRTVFQISSLKFEKLFSRSPALPLSRSLFILHPRL